MTQVCNSPLPNIGSRCRFSTSEIHQLVFASIYNDAGALNKISLADAVTLANWQTKFNVYNFSATPLTKFVPTGRLHLIQPDQQEAITVDEGGYMEKLADGRYDISARWNNPSPWQVEKIKELETKGIAIYMIDADGRIMGKTDGTDLYPIPLQSFMATNYNFKSYETQAHIDMMMSLANARDINELWGVELTTGNPNSINDFFSLLDCTATVSTPAVTGCVVDIALSETAEAVSGLAAGTSYTKWKFVKVADGTVVSLAADTSLTESTTVPGRYTVNEAALLTSGSAYYLQISISPFDIAEATVTVP
jgi:hypothetical protein